jgi:hypothetical protein
MKAVCPARSGVSNDPASGGAGTGWKRRDVRANGPRELPGWPETNGEGGDRCEMAVFGEALLRLAVIYWNN